MAESTAEFQAAARILAGRAVAGQVVAESLAMWKLMTATLARVDSRTLLELEPPFSFVPGPLPGEGRGR